MSKDLTYPRYYKLPSGNVVAKVKVLESGGERMMFLKNNRWVSLPFGVFDESVCGDQEISANAISKFPQFAVGLNVSANSLEPRKMTGQKNASGPSSLVNRILSFVRNQLRFAVSWK